MNETFTSIAQANPVIQNIQKGHISDAFSYGNSSLKFKMSGKDMKEKLLKRKGVIEGIITTKLSTVDNLKETIGVEPTSEVDSYYKRGFDITNTPKMYTYDQLCCNEKEGIVNVSSQETESPEKTKRSNMEKYNYTVRELLECTVDLMIIDLLVNNLSSTEKYELTLDQLKTIGI